MAKVSEKELTDIGQDWGNDGTGLPYSGKEVQKFIKEELNKRPDKEASKVIITDELQSQLFGNGTRKVVTAIEGTSEALTVTTLDSTGTETSETINIGSPDTNDRIVTITSHLTNPYINVGGQTNLVYGYTVADYQGDIIDNQTAEATLTLSRQEAIQPFYTTNLGSIGSTTEVGLTNQVVDLTNILSENIKNSARINATLAIQYSYSYVDEEGKTVTKTIKKSRTAIIEVLSLSLSVPYNIGTINTGQLPIQYTVKGNGSKTVQLYRNGILVDSTSDITNSSYTGVFVIDASKTANYQIVAETTAGTTSVKSSSFYFDVIGEVSNRAIAIKYEDSTGAIQGEGSYKNPSVDFNKFNSFRFEYFVYNSTSTQSDLMIDLQEIGIGGEVISSQKSHQQVERNVYTYSKRVKLDTKLAIKLESGTEERTISINPIESNINLSIPTDTLVLNLDADGRSNSEANPQNWSYGEYETTFSKVNWQSNGWLDDNGSALVLKNGAKAIINYPLFQYIDGQSVTKSGCTFEILFKCSNPTLDPHDIITCNWEGAQGRTTGLKITTNYVGVNTGTVTEYKDDSGQITQTVEDAVGSQYAADTYYKYAFVIDPNLGDKGLCLGYLDGILSFVSDIPNVFANNNNVPITIDSSYADVYVKSIKYYSTALTSDECVNDYIIDQNDMNVIETLYNKNSVLGIDNLGNTYVSPSKIRAMGKGVMIISPSLAQTGETVNIQDLNKSSDKKSYYGPFRVDYFAPESDLNLGYQSVATKGNPFNFTHTECAIRVQGTTSTKRPRKNFRLHYNKKNKNDAPAEGSFIVGGEVKDNFKYAMSQDAVEVPVSCLKVDYVDSSMTHNTGGALVYNELVKAVPAMWNEAQKHEYDGTNLNSIKTRVAIEGFPIDVFAASSVINPEYTDRLDDSNYTDLVYMGQYNFNNDKSESGKVFGFDGAYKYNEDFEYDENGKYEAICIEFLDNTAPLDLFKVTFNPNGTVNEDATFSGFANALEIRAPEKITDQVEKYGLDSLATTPGFETYSYVADRVKSLYMFIGECVSEVAANNGVDVYDLNSYTSEQFEALDWTSSKFESEASKYFNLENICGWYIWTDYTLSVDQRAKNMMLYTMSDVWMIEYYDGDTAYGERNDTFLAYDYLTDRNTWDYAVKQYAIQGHDSWMWYLIRANFNHILESICQQMRSSGKFSAEYFKSVFNSQIVGSWSQRQYNYSQDYKYIQPLNETGYPTDIGTNYINAAQGSRQAHRDYFLDNRFALLDSKYQAGNYADDNFLYYGADGIESNDITIVSSIPFYFGWKTPNTPVRERKFANADNNYTIKLNIVGNTANNPASILGASKIKELHIGAINVDIASMSTIPGLNDGVHIEFDSLEKKKGFSIRILGSVKQYASKWVLLGRKGSKWTSLNEAPIDESITLDSDNDECAIVVVPTAGTSIDALLTKMLSGEATINIVAGGNASWSVDQSKQLTLPSLQKLVASNLEANASGPLYLPNCTSLSYLDLHNSNFTGLYRMESNARVEYIDASDTPITNVRLADGCPIKLMKLGNPSILFLSNFDELKYNGETTDTLKVQSWSNLEQLVVNNCPNINWQKLVTKLQQSASTTKWLRITGIDRTDDITWLDQFISKGGITWAGLDAEGNEVKDVQLVGHLYLPKYEDDSTVASYQSKFPSLIIHQPEYTLIETDETVADESGGPRTITGSTTNLDNNTGYRTSTLYTPSGHISKIINNCHRYLGKLIQPGNLITLEGNPNDTSDLGKSFDGRDLSGIMLVCQLADANSTYYNTGYPFTQRTADLSGLTNSQGVYSGEVYVRVPRFWYKGINYNPAEAPLVKSFRYTAYSYNIEKPNVSPDVTSMSVESIMSQQAAIDVDNGLYESSALVKPTDAADNISDRIESSSRHDVIRVAVDGYKKVRYPASVVHGCTVFTDSSGNVITDSEGKVSGIGEFSVTGNIWLYDGMYVIATIPESAKYLYITLPRYYGTSGVISCNYSDFYVVLHKGSKFNSGADMTDTNAKEWIADMEPDWVEQDSICIGASKCSTNGASLYTSFDGTQIPARGTDNTNKPLSDTGSWFQYSMRRAACNRGLQLIDYETSKLIAMLFMARYGRRNSTNELGVSGGNYCGYSKLTGMTDSTTSNNVFIGIENIHNDPSEWMDKVYYANETLAHRSKLRITLPDGSNRRVYSIGPSGGYPRTLAHGKYCDIVSCSSQSGTSTTYYPDRQMVNGDLSGTWASTRAILRGSFAGDWAHCGVFLLYSSYSVRISNSGCGSRLMFRGNIVETADVDEFLAAEEWRES